jgi:hypothetical protein
MSPLSGQAKTDYQREYMREYRQGRRRRGKRSAPVSAGDVGSPPKPPKATVRPSLGLSKHEQAYRRKK